MCPTGGVYRVVPRDWSPRLSVPEHLCTARRIRGYVLSFNLPCRGNQIYDAAIFRLWYNICFLHYFGPSSQFASSKLSPQTVVATVAKDDSVSDPHYNLEGYQLMLYSVSFVFSFQGMCQVEQDLKQFVSCKLSVAVPINGPKIPIFSFQL